MLLSSPFHSPDAFLGSVAAVVDPVQAFTAWAGGCDPWQAETLAAIVYEGEPFLVLFCSRQVGKSSVLAAASFLIAELKPRSFIVLAAPSERQAREVFLKVKSFRQSLGGTYDDSKNTEGELRLMNDSRILVTVVNERTARGLSAVSVMLLDEVSRISDADIQAMIPMLADDGMLCVASTPGARKGFFYNALKEKRGRIITARSTTLPRRAKAVERDRRLMTDATFRVEHLLEFGENGSSFFNMAHIREKAFVDVPALRF